MGGGGGGLQPWRQRVKLTGLVLVLSSAKTMSAFCLKS